MVDTGGLHNQPIPEMILAETVISPQDAVTDYLPFRAVSTLVSGLPWLKLSPAFALVGFAVTGWVSCSGAAAANATGFWCAWRHIVLLKID